MAAPEDKLPRVSHADRPRDDEKVLRKGGADLNNGWLGRHGNLYLTEERLVFVPTPLDHLLMAKRRVGGDALDGGRVLPHLDVVLHAGVGHRAAGHLEQPDHAAYYIAANGHPNPALHAYFTECIGGWLDRDVLPKLDSPK